MTYLVFIRLDFRSSSVAINRLETSDALASNIRHIIEVVPRPADVYTQIKNRLISCFSISAETRFRQLLRGEVISDGKPSLHVTRIRALNDGNCSDAILESVFLEQMPSHDRVILAMSNVEDLQELTWRTSCLRLLSLSLIRLHQIP